MFNFVADVKCVSDEYKKLVEAMRFTKDNYILVGISQKETTRKKSDDVTNAELLFIHTNGSPINHVPARPVIEPALEDDRIKLSNMLKKSAQLAMDGDKEGAYKQLELAGMKAQNDARGWFVNPKNGWPPNSPSVEAEKRRKGSTDPKPLIDTGELRKSITYVMVKDGGRKE